MKQPAIYILTNKKNGTLYTGVTSNLIQRIWQHKQKLMDGFSKQYGCDQLVYYELAEDMNAAITREKRLKKYTRAAKIKLIEQENPHWQDLYESLLG